MCRSLLLLAAVLTITAGCRKAEEPANAGEPVDDVQEKSAPEQAPPADKAEVSKDAGAADSDSATGIASCDQYIKKYEDCLGSKIPEEARGAMTEAFKAQRDAWRQSAEAAKGNQDMVEQLSKNCVEAMTAARAPMQQYGCDW